MMMMMMMTKMMMIRSWKARLATERMRRSTELELPYQLGWWVPLLPVLKTPTLSGL
jgi:hypothetical protein